MSNTISKSDDVCVVNSNTIGAASGARSAHRPEHPRLVGFWVVQSLVSCVVCRILCFWRHLYCVSLELRFLIIPLVSSNHSYVRNNLVFLFLHICDVLLYKSHLLVYKNYAMNIPSFSS